MTLPIRKLWENELLRRALSPEIGDTKVTAEEAVAAVALVLQEQPLPPKEDVRFWRGHPEWGAAFSLLDGAIRDLDDGGAAALAIEAGRFRARWPADYLSDAPVPPSPMEEDR